jgi:SAM-dependent methyltransferase
LTHIAEGYERLIVPRFEPWTAVGLATLGELLAAWRPRRAERAAANGDGDDGDDGGADETQEDTADDDSPLLSVLVPCCGPGHELPRVAEVAHAVATAAQISGACASADVMVVGVDLAPGMIEVRTAIAAQRAAHPAKSFHSRVRR